VTEEVGEKSEEEEGRPRGVENRIEEEAAGSEDES
jgi:hypothetical protein